MRAAVKARARFTGLTLLVAVAVPALPAAIDKSPETIDVVVGQDLVLRGRWFDPSRCGRPPTSTIALQVGEAILDVPSRSVEALLPVRPPRITVMGESGFRMSLPMHAGCPAIPLQIVMAQIAPFDAAAPEGVVLRETAERTGASATALGLAKFRDSGQCKSEGKDLLLCDGRQTIGGVSQPVQYRLAADPKSVMASGAPLHVRCLRPDPKPICTISEEFAGRVTIEWLMTDDQPSLEAIEGDLQRARALVQSFRRP